MVTAVGRSKHELDTPALCAEVTTIQRNIEKMAGTMRRHGVGWRPHTKGQKIPALAHMEIAAGALGVTCAKLGEAEVMAAAGIRDLLIANQVVGTEKVTRLAALRQYADVMVAVDSLGNALQIDAAARDRRVRLRVLIEVNVGMDRAGVAPGPPTVELAKRLGDLQNLYVAGVMGWEAQATAIPDPVKKKAVVDAAVGGLVETGALCRAAGLPAQIVSCGGTGTYWLSAAVPGVTEIQAGGGILHDILYAERFGVPHEFALTIMSTVTSRPTPTRIICDAGKKTMSSDGAMPRPLGLGAVAKVALSAEHGVVTLAEPSATPCVGDKLEWIVGYSDTTTFLHDELYLTRDGIVEQVWPILGRGKLR